MRKNLVLIYRIAGIIVSLVAYLVFFFALAIFFQVGFQGEVAIGVFMSGSMVIYSLLTGIFGRMVLLQGLSIRHSLRDWINVNAYVTLIFMGLCLYRIVRIAINPSPLKDLFDKLSTQMQVPAGTFEQALVMMKGVSVICIIALVHSLWTLSLVRRYKEFFK